MRTITDHLVDLAAIKLQIFTNGVTYTAASGGFVFDLATALAIGAPNDLAYINPGDIIDLLPSGVSANGFVPSAIVVGTPIYAPQVGSGVGSAAGTPPAATSQLRRS